MRLRRLTGLICLTVLITTACSNGGESGNPSADTSSLNSAEASSEAQHGAPSVPEPLGVRDISNEPCSAVTEKQIDQFPGNLDETQISDTTFSGNGQSCGWIFQGDQYSLGSISGGVVLPSDEYHGLSSIYRAEQDGSYDTFRPFEAAGYPAVINNESDMTDSGSCRISIGLRDDTAYRIDTLLDPEHPFYEQACTPAKKLASFVVKNLKDRQ